MKQRCNKIF